MLQIGTWARGSMSLDVMRSQARACSCNKSTMFCKRDCLAVLSAYGNRIFSYTGLQSFVLSSPLLISLHVLIGCLTRSRNNLVHVDR